MQDEFSELHARERQDRIAADDALSLQVSELRSHMDTKATELSNQVSTLRRRVGRMGRTMREMQATFKSAVVALRWIAGLLGALFISAIAAKYPTAGQRLCDLFMKAVS